MRTFKEKVKEDIKSEVYDILSDMMYNYVDVGDIDLLKNATEEAFEHFMIRFFEEDGE